jgi:hypothetical protein
LVLKGTKLTALFSEIMDRHDNFSTGKVFAKKVNLKKLK